MKNKFLSYLTIMLMMLTATVSVAQFRGNCTANVNQYYIINGTTTNDNTANPSVTVPNVPIAAAVKVGVSPTYLDWGQISTFTIAISKDGVYQSTITKGSGSYGSAWEPTIPASYFTIGAAVQAVMTVTPNGTTAQGCSTPWTYTYNFNVATGCVPSTTTFYYNNNVGSGWKDPATAVSGTIAIPGVISLGTAANVVLGTHLGSGCTVAYSDGLGWTASGSGNKTYNPKFTYNPAGPQIRTVTATVTSNCSSTPAQVTTFTVTSANTCTPSTVGNFYHQDNGTGGWNDGSTTFDANRNTTISTLFSPGSTAKIEVGVHLNGGTVVWSDASNASLSTSSQFVYYPNLTSGQTKVLTATYNTGCSTIAYTYTLQAATLCVPLAYTPYYNNGGWHNAADTATTNLDVQLGSTVILGINPGGLTALWTDGLALNKTSGEFTYQPNFTTGGQTRDVVASFTDNCGTAKLYTFHITSVCTSATPLPYYNNGNGWVNKLTTDTAISFDVELGKTANLGINPSLSFDWTGTDGFVSRTASTFSYDPAFTAEGQTRTITASKTNVCGVTSTYVFTLNAICIHSAPAPYYNNDASIVYAEGVTPAGVVTQDPTVLSTSISMAIRKSIVLGINRTPSNAVGTVSWTSSTGLIIPNASEITFPGFTAIGKSATVTGTYTDKCGTQTVYVYNLSVPATVEQLPTSVCKGTTVGAIVGVSSLKFYKDAKPATLALASTAALAVTAPSTTTGTYYVTTTTDNVESARSPLTITINALPTDLASVITGVGPLNSLAVPVAASAVAVGPYVGTNAVFTYSVSDATLSYLWTVPNGATLLSGQGTNSITVNYLNVPAGAGAVGSITVQAVNASGCGSAAKTLAISKALPAAPSALKLTDASITVVSPALPVAITNFAKYMGTYTALTLTATPSVTATATDSYVWELPTGVNKLSGGSTNVITVNFAGVTDVATTALSINVKAINNVGTTAVSKSLALTATVPAVPAAIKMTNNTEGADTSLAVTNITNFVGTNTQFLLVATPSSLATTYEWDLPTGVHAVSGVTSNLIVVTFDAGTTSLSVGVRAKNKIGASVTTKTLALVATVPAAPAALKLTNDAAPLVAVAVISKYIGTPTPLTLTATASALATSYTWELPSGVTQLSGGTSNVITVDFAGVATGTTSLYLGAKAVNGVGSSSTSNSAVTVIPSTSSTAKLLKVTSAVPAAVATVTGQIAGVCGGSSYEYTMAASAVATSYVITAPTGSVVTSASHLDNGTNELTTSDLTFTVALPQGFVAIATTLAADKSIVIASVNGVGPSALNKTVVLSTLMPAIGVATGGATFTRCANQTFSIPAVVGATEYVWTFADGASIVSGQGTTTVVVSFSGVTSSKTKNIITVKATNSCGVSTVAKTISLTSTACPVVRLASQNEVSSTEVYPNPTSGVFNVDVTVSNTSVVEVSVYSFDGTLVVSPKAVKLQEGTNTISQDISSLNNGIYFVQIANALNNEIITKKLIKQ